MKMYELFHRAFELTTTHVASFESEASVLVALEQLYTGTQNIDSNWVTERGQLGVVLEPSQRVIKAGGCRSTSVGDYAVCIDKSTMQVTYYECRSIGWQEVAAAPGPHFDREACLRAAG